MISSNKQINIEKIICTSLEKINECIFILQFFKNSIDCIIIDNPLNEIMPQHKAIDDKFEFNENSLQPRVTSNNP